MQPPPTDQPSEPRTAASATARAEASRTGPLLGYAARPARARRIRRWIRPGSVLFFVLVTVLAVVAGWGAWKWRLATDRQMLEECATISSGWGLTGVTLTHAPSRAAMRHLSRLPGPVVLNFQWPESENAAAADALGAADLGKVRSIGMVDKINTDLLLKQITRPDRGLKALIELDVAGTLITDAGLKEMSRPDSGLKALTWLTLGRTKITDAGLKELTRPDSGLKALITLYLVNTNVTDAGLKELTRPDSGLKALTKLSLSRTKITDAGLKELSRPGSGLKALTTLDLGGTQVTDAGLKELALPDSGFKALTELGLANTKVTYAGVAALQAARPGLRIIR